MSQNALAHWLESMQFAQMPRPAVLPVVELEVLVAPAVEVVVLVEVVEVPEVPVDVCVAELEVVEPEVAPEESELEPLVMCAPLDPVPLPEVGVFRALTVGLHAQNSSIPSRAGASERTIAPR